MTTPVQQWEIPPKVWAILFTWGVSVLILTGLLSWGIWLSEHRARLRADRAMCAMIDLITSGPAPVAGPAGDRARAVAAAMHAYRGTLDCG